MKAMHRCLVLVGLLACGITGAAAQWTVLNAFSSQEIQSHAQTDLSLDAVTASLLTHDVEMRRLSYTMPFLGEEAAVSGAGAWLALAYAAIGCSSAAYWLIVWANNRIESSIVNLYCSIQPVVTSTAAVVFLGETVKVSDVGAGVLILLGLLVAVRSPPRAEAGEAEDKEFEGAELLPQQR